MRARRNIPGWLRLLPLLGPALLALPAAALQCPRGIVSPGDHETEVLDACGEPDSRRPVAEHPSRVIVIDGRPVRQQLAIAFAAEEWVYAFSEQRFRRLLRFRNGRLVDVDDARQAGLTAPASVRGRPAGAPLDRGMEPPSGASVPAAGW